MIRWLMKSVLKRFGARYDYDTSYMQELADVDVSGTLKLGFVASFLQHRFGAPKEAYFAAKVRSSRRADCGPCLRLVVNMAVEAGVPVATLLPALDKGTATPDVALAIRFADALIDNAPELMEVTEAVRERFGERARAGLASAVVAGQFYPLLKRGLGHAQACAPVVHGLLAADGLGAGGALPAEGALNERLHAAE